MTEQQQKVHDALQLALRVFHLHGGSTHRVFFVALPTERSDVGESLYVTDCNHCLRQAAPVLRTIANSFDPQS